MEKKIINDFHISNAGDDLELIMTHHKGEGAEDVHKLAWDTFMKGTELAREKKIYAAGQDILADTFSGNVKGMGPGSAEMVIEERRSEPIAIFMADAVDRFPPDNKIIGFKGIPLEIPLPMAGQKIEVVNVELWIIDNFIGHEQTTPKH